MAQRNILLNDNPRLRKKCKPVEKINQKIQDLIDDMTETMYLEKGVGLAAPQVGMLKRIITIDVGDGLVVLLNPEITKSEGSSREEEGCLSLPDDKGIVIRPEKVVVKGMDRNGAFVEHTATGLFARALCHEIDHLDGILFIDKVIPQEELLEDE